MKFFIGFEEKTRTSPSSQHAFGRIALDSSSEVFQSSLSLWSREQYREQWVQAVQRIMQGQEKSALITDIRPIETANFFTWWPMWKINGLVHIQNQLLFLDQLAEPFAPARYYDFVGKRETLSEDGERISEWTLTVDDLAGFLASTGSSSTMH